MEVILTKKAKYDFSTDKHTAIPSDVFNMLVEDGIGDVSTNDNSSVPEMIVFEDKNEYLNRDGKINIDMSRNFYVSKKGQIFCFLDTNGSTDTEENTGE